MAKIFVTGGAGFIGSHTVDQLCLAGHEVTVYDKKAWEEAENLHPQEGNINYISGDILDCNLLRQSMAEHTHVLHLAALVSVQDTINEPLSSHEVNVTGALQVFEAARSLGIKRVVYASSAAVYGPQTGCISETTPCEPLSPYGLHKVMNDEYASIYTGLYGQSMLGLRYFNIYGSRQDTSSPYSGVIALFTKKARANEPITIYGDGSVGRDFVSVYDVARANLLALMSDSVGICNIASGQETTVSHLIDLIEEIIGRPIKRGYKEVRPGDIPRSVAVVDCAKLQLGFEAAVPLREGLKELLT